MFEMLSARPTHQSFFQLVNSGSLQTTPKYSLTFSRSPELPEITAVTTVEQDFMNAEVAWEQSRVLLPPCVELHSVNRTACDRHLSSTLASVFATSSGCIPLFLPDRKPCPTAALIVPCARHAKEDKSNSIMARVCCIASKIPNTTGP